MESGPVCRQGNRPRMLICYLCGREYGSKSLHIHIPQCQKKWLMEEEQKPKYERRPLPPQPNAENAIGNGGSRAFDNFNLEASAAFEQTLEQCPNCQRRFLPKPFKTHQKSCSAAKPAKPAGTGLIKYSLTNRLVPGAIAGSLHGKAKNQPVPLRLCRPPPRTKPRLKSTQRPAWSRAGGSPNNEGEDIQVPMVRHKPSAQEWCLQSETNFPSKQAPNLQSQKNSAPRSRSPFQSKNGIIESVGVATHSLIIPRAMDEEEVAWCGAGAGGKNAHLVSKFGEIWNAHRQDMNLPSTRTHPNPRPGGAAKEAWYVPTGTSSSAHPRQQSKSNKNAFSSSQVVHSSRQQPARGLRSSHVERALDFVSFANSLPPSKQQAALGGAALPSQGGTRGDLRHHHRSPAFY